MLALYTPADGTANNSHFLKVIPDAPEHIIWSQYFVHANVIYNLFKKLLNKHEIKKLYTQINFLHTKTMKLFIAYSIMGRAVKALRYKPAGRGFDSRWCHWNFSVT
jgi:hypothetical protein